MVLLVFHRCPGRIDNAPACSLDNIFETVSVSYNAHDRCLGKRFPAAVLHDGICHGRTDCAGLNDNLSHLDTAGTR